jgi:PAS domain S-box-containing protein
LRSFEAKDGDLGVLSFTWDIAPDRLTLAGEASHLLEAQGIHSLEALIAHVAREDRPGVTAGWREHAETGLPLCLTMPLALGSASPRRISVQARRDGARSVGTFADVTGRAPRPAPNPKAALDAGNDAREIQGVGPYVFDADEGMHVWSRQLCRLLGYPADDARQIASDAIPQWLHRDDRERFLREARAAMATDAPYWLEYRMVAQDGRILHVEDRGVPFGPRDPGTGRFRCARGVLIDVTERAGMATRLGEASAMLSALFDNAPLGLAIWDTDLRFVRLNQHLAEINGLPVEAHVGRRPDEILEGIEGMDVLMERWREVMRSGEPWLDVEVEGETAAAPDKRRTWLEHFYPITVDGRTIGIAGIVEETTERKAAEMALRQSEMRLKEVLDGTLAFVGILDPEGRVTEINAAALEMGGHRREDVVGSHVWESAFWNADASSAQAIREAVALAREGGVSHFDLVTRGADGADIHLDWMLSPALDDSGNVRYMTISAVDITERVQAAEKVALLLREVNHRSKNMLALVQAIARQTARSGAKDFIDRFSERISSLSSSQDLLVTNDWKPVDLRTLVLSQIGHLRDTVDRQITLEGPPCQLPPEQAHILGMAVHELATNAMKYGALSSPDGRVEIGWTACERGTRGGFTMRWAERNGPEVTAPERRGFGTTVLKDLVESSLRAEVELSYAPDGFVWTLNAGEDATAPAAGAASGRDVRVLVVEDEALLAYELADALHDAGFDVLGPAASLAAARRLLEAGDCDIALLDINLGTETSAPLAEDLIGRHVPVVAMSGYSKDQHPDVFRTAHFIPKPVDVRRLAPKIRSILA